MDMEIKQLLYYQKHKQSTNYNLSKISIAVATLTTTLMIKWLSDYLVVNIFPTNSPNFTKSLILYNYKSKMTRKSCYCKQSHRFYEEPLPIPKEEITYIGFYTTAPLLPLEIKKIQQFENTRNQYLNWQRDLETAELEPTIIKLLSIANDAILKHMKPDDLAAVFKEERGIKIFKKNGGTYNHCLEVKQANNAVQKSMIEIERKIIKFRRESKYNSNEIKILHKKLYQLSKFEDVYMRFSNEIKCIRQLKYLMY